MLHKPNFRFLVQTVLVISFAFSITAIAQPQKNNNFPVKHETFENGINLERIKALLHDEILFKNDIPTQLDEIFGIDSNKNFPNPVIPNSSLLKYGIDTAIIYCIGDVRRYTYSFSEKGKMKSELIEHRLSDVWVPMNRTNIEFDENGNRTELIYKYWENGKWNDSYRELYTTDERGNMLSKLLLGYDEDGVWRSFRRFNYKYDNNNNIVFYSWENIVDSNLDLWTGRYRITSIYDENNYLLSEVLEGCVTDVYSFTTRRTYNYDSLGRSLGFLMEGWFNNVWTLGNRVICYYNANGTSQVQQYERLIEGVWTPESRETKTSSENGNVITIFNEDLNNSACNNLWRYIYIYDSEKRMLSSSVDIFENQAWKPESHRLFGYDPNGNLNTIKLEQMLNSQWAERTNMIEVNDNVGNYYSFFGSELSLHYKQFLTKTEKEENINPVTYQLYSNYPNPFNPATTITYQLPHSGYTSLKIFDMLGNEVTTLVNEQKEMGKYTIQFDASSMASGMYLYQLKVNDFVSVKKMILLK